MFFILKKKKKKKNAHVVNRVWKSFLGILCINLTILVHFMTVNTFLWYIFGFLFFLLFDGVEDDILMICYELSTWIETT